VGAIAGWVRWLRAAPLDFASVERALTAIERSTSTQIQIINDLLDVSRIIEGRLGLDVRPLSLAPLVEAAVETIRPAAVSKNVRMSVFIEPATFPMRGDVVRLEQVLVNLLSNAVKFTPRGGQVAVSLEREGARVTITVSDTGEGIDPEFLPFVFERFRQFEGATTRAHGGLGLGLAIVRHLVELHGGTVSAASPGRGRGATFTVTLPLAHSFTEFSGDERARLAGAGGITRSHVQDPDQLRDLRVLLVDDERDARELFISILTHYGAEVKACASAAEALQTLDEWRPDVLVSDIGMPGEDGYEFIRKVRAREPERGGRIPALALTAYAGTQDERRSLVMGYQMYTPKPVEPHKLAATIAILAGRLRGD
jgi:CheY-like chemotaxis protein